MHYVFDKHELLEHQYSESRLYPSFVLFEQKQRQNKVKNRVMFSTLLQQLSFQEFRT